MRNKLIELIHKCEVEALKANLHLSPERIADYLLERGVIAPPCKVGDVIYKICPKCNEHHNGNCEHCAWRGCFSHGCDIGVRIYSDGSHNEHELQIIPYKLTKHNFFTVLERFNTLFFATEEEAKIALAEYDEIRKIEDWHKRYETYIEWETKRETYHIINT